MLHRLVQVGVVRSADVRHIHLDVAKRVHLPVAGQDELHEGRVPPALAKQLGELDASTRWRMVVP